MNSELFSERYIESTYNFHKNRLENGLPNVSGNTARSYNNYIYDQIAALGLNNPLVIDIGCGYGGLCRSIGSIVADGTTVGVEVDEIKASIASMFCDQVYVGEVMELIRDNTLFGDLIRKADLIVLGDVLEHMLDPWRMLREITKLLQSGTHIILSIPCITSISSIYKLMQGTFTYEADGIFDITHLRFFGPSDIIALAKVALDNCSINNIVVNYCPDSLAMLKLANETETVIDITPGITLRFKPNINKTDCESLIIRGLILDCVKV
jgi:2-polyprenyl-3-methyl-5-hydroxy-6-metoxy-1,4-benzoquinol methylase